MLQTHTRASVPQALTSWSARGVQSDITRPPAIEANSSAASRIAVKRGDLIFDEGDAAIYLYRLVKGSVRLGRVMTDGHRQICDFLLAGDLLGFANGDDYAFSAEAIEDCTLVRYRRSSLTSLIHQDGAFASEMQQLTASGLYGAYEHMVRLCHRSARGRVAWFILAMAKRSAQGDRLELPMSRCDIADYLGMAHETVSRAFTQLKKSGAIAEIAVNSIMLLNRKALEA